MPYPESFLELGEEIKPFENPRQNPRAFFQIGRNLNPDIVYTDIPFRFKLEEQNMIGKALIKLDQSTPFDFAPPIFPYPLRGYHGYTISSEDYDLGKRRLKIANYYQQGNNLTNRGKEEEAGNSLLLSVVLRDVFGKSWSESEQQLLKKVRFELVLGKGAVARHWEGQVYFARDFIPGSAPGMNVDIERQTPEGWEFKTMEWGRVDTYYPADGGPLAHNSLLTRGQGLIGMGHYLYFPEKRPDIYTSIKIAFLDK